jgi:puromycin-sensitive aminopeptidase
VSGAAFRLPGDVRPRHYALHVELDPERGKRFRGEVTIELEVKRVLRAFELHAVGLKVSSARIEARGRRQRASVSEVAAHETVRVQTPQPLEKGRATLSLRFSGKLRNDLRGLYFASSGDHGYAFTQLEDTDARRFFPCFDEPSFKARFDVEVTTAREHAVIANGAIVSTARLKDGRKRVRFATTPPLSTYLLALAVGDLRASHVTKAGQTPIRVWHVPGREKLTTLARREARDCLLALERYFGVPYPYGKLDLVAVPDFGFGAMENAGAVFFRETLLLVDEKRVTLGEKRRAIEVICHELAHMWYGNLVTMAWWDDLWLNEAFATWMAFQIVDELHPELSMWTDFGHARDSALSADALKHTHPIYAEVKSPEQATENFDLITYEKGAAVVRMLDRYLGPKTFRAGVRDYIRRHAEANARAADLWRALRQAAGENVAAVVRPWIERDGFPLLRVQDDGELLRVSQERFRASGPAGAKGKGSAEKAWPVPVVLATGGKRPAARHLVKRRRASLPRPRGRFVYANADEGGFYRPLHEGEAFARLVRHFGRLSDAERLGLLRHTWAQVHAGYAPLSQLLSLLSPLAGERDPDVLGALPGPLTVLIEQVEPVVGAGPCGRLRAVVAETFGPALQAAGLDAKRREPEASRLHRAVLLQLVGGVAEDAETIAQATVRVEAELSGGEPLDSNLAGVAMALAAQAGGAGLHAHYLDASQHAGTPQAARRARMALAEFRDPAMVERTLRACVTEAIPTQDRVLVLARCLRNPAARERTWSFIKRNWTRLEKKIPSLLVSRLIDATPALQTPAYRREVRAFFKAHPVPTATRALSQADERFRLDAAFRKRAARELRAWAAEG